MDSVQPASDPLAAAALTNAERGTVQRLIGLLDEELGSDLHAVWLYGSRARGDARIEETDPDLKSDIDLMVIVDGSRGWSLHGGEVIPLVNEAADAEGESPTWYSVLVHDPEWLRQRREIESFFIQSVDRDKLVLYGSPLI